MGSKYDIRSHKINIGMPKKASDKKEAGLNVDLINNSPSRFSINKMSAGSSRNLRYQQQDEQLFLEDNADPKGQIPSEDNNGNRKINDTDQSSLDQEKSK